MTTVWDIFTMALLVLGTSFMFLGAFSLVRFSGFFRRVHGPGMASTLGIGALLVASMIYHGVHGNGLHPRELLIVVFLFLTAPVSAHMLSRAALSLMDERPVDPSHKPDTDDPVHEDIDNRNV